MSLPLCDLSTVILSVKFAVQKLTIINGTLYDFVSLCFAMFWIWSGWFLWIWENILSSQEPYAIPSNWTLSFLWIIKKIVFGVLKKIQNFILEILMSLCHFKASFSLLPLGPSSFYLPHRNSSGYYKEPNQTNIKRVSYPYDSLSP